MPPPATVRRSSVVASTPTTATETTSSSSSSSDVPVTKDSSSSSTLHHPTLPDLPKKIWSYDQEPNLSNLSIKNSNDLTINLVGSKFLPRKIFKNDYLSYCKVLGIRPHPSILPIEHSVDSAAVVLPSMKLANRRQQRYGNGTTTTTDTTTNESTLLSSPLAGNYSSDPLSHPSTSHEEPEYFNFSFIKDIIIKQILFGSMDMFALTMALRTSSTITSVTFKNAKLNVKQLFLLADTLPFTTIISLTIDDNALPIDENGPVSLDPPETILSPVLLSGSSLPSSSSTTTTTTTERPPTATENRRTSVSASGNRRTSTVPGPTTDRPVSPPKASITGSLPNESDSTTNSHSYVYVRNRETVWSYFLKRYSPLVRCSLRSCGINSKEAIYIGNALALNTTLQEFVLSHNRSLGDEGIANLCQGLLENRTLVSLQIADTGASLTSIPSLLSIITPTILTVQQEKDRETYNQTLVTELLNEVNKLGLPNFNNQILNSITNAKFPSLTSLHPPPPAEPVAVPAPAPAPTKGKAPVPAPAPAPVAVPEVTLQPTDPGAVQTGCLSLHTLDISANMMIGIQGLRNLVKGIVNPPNIPSMNGTENNNKSTTTDTVIPVSIPHTPSTSPVKPTSSSNSTSTSPVKPKENTTTNNDTIPSSSESSSSAVPSVIVPVYSSSLNVLAAYNVSYPDPSPNSIPNSLTKNDPTTKEYYELFKQELSTVNCTLCG